MATPTFTLPTSGSDPRKTTKDWLEENLNQIIEYLDNARIRGDAAQTTGLNFQGPWDASTEIFPSENLDGGPLKRGDFFWVSVEGTFGGETYSVNEPLVAVVDNPSTSDVDDWYHAPVDPSLLPLIERLDTYPVNFATVTDFFSASIADIKKLANATTGTAYVETSDGVGLATVDLEQFAAFNRTTTGGVEISVLPTAVGLSGSGAWGAVADSAGSLVVNKESWEAAESAGRSVSFPVGTTYIDNMSTIEGGGWRGAARWLTTLDGDGENLALISEDYASISDIRLRSSGGTLVDVQAPSYFNSISSAWFGPAAEGITIDNNDAFWWSVSDMVMRDCDVGISNNTGQDVNAWTITGSTFYHFNPLGEGVGYSLDLNAPRGVALLGNHIQNQGWKIDGGSGNVAVGGYWEAYDKPALDLTDTSWAQFGVSSIPGTRYKIDRPTAEKWAGQSPNISAQDSGGIERVEFLGASVMPYVGAYRNLFPDPLCVTQAAADAISYSPTGAKGTVTINGSSNVEIAFSSATQRSGFRLPDADHISLFVKWRATSGDVRLTLGNVSVGYTLDHDSADDSEWRYSYAYAPATTGQSPYVIFQTTGGVTATVEVDTFIVTDTWVAVRERMLSLSEGPVVASSITASGSAVVDGSVSSPLFNSVSTSTVTVAASATETLHTFSGYGLYSVMIDQGTFLRTDQTYWIGRVLVDTRGLLTFYEDAKNQCTISGSGYDLQITNGSGGSRNLSMKATRIG